MIHASKAEKIMQLYERDYDNFLDKLKQKRAAKKKATGSGSKQTTSATQTLEEAQAHKQDHLSDKAKKLVASAGGLEGILKTGQNVVKYFKPSDVPSDYEVNMGATPEDPTKTEKTILGMPPMVVYMGGGLLALVILYGASVMLKKPEGAQPGRLQSNLQTA